MARMFPRSQCLVLMLSGLLAGGCIDSTGDAALDDGEEDGGRAVDGGRSGDDAERPRGDDAQLASDAHAPADAAALAGDAEGSDATGAADLGPTGACGAFIERIEQCLLPRCPALRGAPLDDACRGRSQRDMEALTALRCGPFVGRLMGESEDVRVLCSDEPPPECGPICDRVADCGIPVGDACGAICRRAGPEVRRCLQDAGDCMQLGACFRGGQGPGPGPPPLERRCEGYCQRQAVCVFQSCAPGTLTDGWGGDCFEACMRAEPSPEEMQWVFGQLCPEVVAGVRAHDPAIDERCEAAPEDACANLCAASVVPCADNLDQAACEAACAGWDQVNFACVQLAEGCRELQPCFGDPGGQDRCVRFCDRTMSCLLESCPPRIISPELATFCSANCLDDPPTEAEVQEWEAAQCVEVRRWVYRRNRQLAPICEGGRDFRPSGEECAAFCDNALQDCLGIGGRPFCLAGCASLTRDQYECALEAQGDCEAVGACIAQ